MARRNYAQRVAVLAATGAGLGAVLTGCATDDTAQYQASWSSVEATWATDTANEKFASDFVLADMAIPTKQGPERMAAYDARATKACPGSVIAERLKKFKADGKVEQITYAPTAQTEIIGTHVEVDPNNVVVVYRTVVDNQKRQAIASRLTLGTTDGKLCVTDWKAL